MLLFELLLSLFKQLCLLCCCLLLLLVMFRKRWRVRSILQAKIRGSCMYLFPAGKFCRAVERRTRRYRCCSWLSVGRLAEFEVWLTECPTRKSELAGIGAIWNSTKTNKLVGCLTELYQLTEYPPIRPKNKKQNKWFYAWKWPSPGYNITHERKRPRSPTKPCLPASKQARIRIAAEGRYVGRSALPLRWQLQAWAAGRQ